MPDTKEYKGLRALCADGCYLMHPEDYVKAKHDADRVKLIDRLQLNNETFTKLAEGSQDLAKGSQQMVKDLLADKETWRRLYTEVSVENAKLKATIEDAWTGWEKVGGFGAGVATGAVILGGILLAGFVL